MWKGSTKFLKCKNFEQSCLVSINMFYKQMIFLKFRLLYIFILTYDLNQNSKNLCHIFTKTLDKITNKKNLCVYLCFCNECYGLYVNDLVIFIRLKGNIFSVFTLFTLACISWGPIKNLYTYIYLHEV